MHPYPGIPSNAHKLRPAAAPRHRGLVKRRARVPRSSAAARDSCKARYETIDGIESVLRGNAETFSIIGFLETLPIIILDRATIGYGGFFAKRIAPLFSPVQVALRHRRGQVARFAVKRLDRGRFTV